MTERSSSRDAHATASTPPGASSTITLASSARPAARATDGRPAPDSTASETSSSASRNERGSTVALAGSCETDIPSMVLRTTAPLGVLVVAPDHREADHRADSEQGGEHEERQEARGQLLPEAAVAAPGGQHDQAHVARDDEAAGQRDRELGGGEVHQGGDGAGSRPLLRTCSTIR